MVANWPYILGGVAVIGGGIYAFTRTEVGSFWVDKLKLSVPIVRRCSARSTSAARSRPWAS
jgi:hypothetical protein